MAAALPPGWEEKYDEASSAPYYENVSTGETSWEYPQADYKDSNMELTDEGEDDPSSNSNTVAALQKEIKKLKKREKKATMKETAMKADINKMKVETRQAKKELADERKRAEAKVRASREDLELALMKQEEDTLKRAIINERSYVKLVQAIHAREEGKSRDALTDLTNLEKQCLAPVVKKVVAEAQANHSNMLNKISKLEEDLNTTQTDLDHEKRERARENADWSIHVENLTKEKEKLACTVESLEQQINEFNIYIEESEARYQQELQRQRDEDVNRISSLTAELQFEKEGRENDLREIAEMWADDMAPPSVLRNQVRSIRKARAEDRLQKLQIENLRFGAQVMCWDQESMNYYRGTVTKIEYSNEEKLNYYEVRWHGGAEAPPVWAKEGELYAIVEEDSHKTQETQTDLRLYDELMNRFSIDKGPRSARGRLDIGSAETDRRVAKALGAKAKREAVELAKISLESVAKLLFKTLDIESNGEIFIDKTWKIIQGREEAKELIRQHKSLEPITRKKYFFSAWKKIEPDFDTPIVWREFRDVCIDALLNSRGLARLEGNSEDEDDTADSESNNDEGDGDNEDEDDDELTSVNISQENKIPLLTEKKPEAGVSVPPNNEGIRAEDDANEQISPWLSKFEIEKDNKIKELIAKATAEEEKMISIHQQEVKLLGKLKEDAIRLKLEYEERRKMMMEESISWEHEKEIIEGRLFNYKIKNEELLHAIRGKSKAKVEIYPGQGVFLNQNKDATQYKEVEIKTDEPATVTKTISNDDQEGTVEVKGLKTIPEEIIDSVNTGSRALEEKQSQVKGRLEQVNKKIQYFYNEINKLKKEKLDQQSAQESAESTDQNGRVETSKYESEISKLEITRSELKNAIENLEGTKAEFRDLLQNVKLCSAEIKRIKTYIVRPTEIDSCLPEIEYAERISDQWTAELKGEMKLWDSQYQCILLSRELRNKLGRELIRGVQNVQELLDHKEILYARREAAEAAVKVADNDIEQSRAHSHLQVVNKTVTEELEFIEHQWKKELLMREKIVDERIRIANEHILRASAALKTSQERQKLRAIIAEEIELELETIKMQQELASNKSKAIEAWTVTKVEKERERREKLVLVRKEAMQRELEWVMQNKTSITGFSEKWISEQEKDRLLQDVELTRRAKQQAFLYFKEQEKLRKAELERIQARCEYYKERQRAQEKSLTNELDTLTETFQKSVNYLQSELKVYKTKYLEWKRLTRERVDMVRSDYFGLGLKLDAEILDLKRKSIIRENWVATLQDDARRNAAEANRLTEKRKREQLRHTRQMDDLNKKYKAMTDHANRLDSWVNSLKGEVSKLHDTIQEHIIRERNLKTEHGKEIRWLKWEIWKRDETARVLGTNLDFAFTYFTETLGRLVGTSKEYNQRLAANGGVEVLLALCKSSRVEIRRLAMQALSNASWNGHTDFRTVVRCAREDWIRWLASITSIAALYWSLKGKKVPCKPLRRLLRLTDLDRFEENPKNGETFIEDMTFIKEEEDTQSLFRSVAFDSTVKVIKGRPTIIPTTVAFSDVGPNLANQERLGRGLSGRETGAQELVRMLYSRDCLLRRLATKTISVLALEDANKIRLGESEYSLRTLLELAENGEIRQGTRVAEFDNVDQAQDHNMETIDIEVDANDDDKAETQRYALAALANLLYKSKENQDKFGRLSGISVLVRLAKSSNDMDVLDSCTAVFANAASMHEENSKRIGLEGGIKVLVDLCDSVHAAEHLDEIGARIQANAAEALVNATKNDSGKNVEKIEQFGVKPLVQLCASEAVTVQRCAGLILGNISQTEAIRIAVGECGGIEALFILCGSEDVSSRENATWALSNLAWNSDNQNRIGKHLPEVVKLCNDPCLQVRENATGALANALFYHEGNRKRIGFFFPACETLVRLLKDENESFKVRENVLRALGTAAYNDAVALQAVIHGVLPSIIEQCKSQYPGLQRYGAFALGNLAVHDIHKPMIVDLGGIEILSWLCGSDCPDTVKYAKEALDILADLSSTKFLELRRKEFGVKGIVQLCLGKEDYDKYGNPLPPQPAVQALACESLANVENIEEVIDAKGLEALVHVLREATDLQREDRNRIDLQKLQTRALWALREIVRRYPPARSILGRMGALKVIFSSLELRDSETKTMKIDYTYGEDVAESSLALIYSMVIEHEVNCRRVFSAGIDILIEIAELGEHLLSNVRKSPLQNNNDEDSKEYHDKDKDEMGQEEEENEVTMAATIQLATDILEVMGPHSWLICSNCSSKERCGSTCSQCGRILNPRVE